MAKPSKKAQKNTIKHENFIDISFNIDFLSNYKSIILIILFLLSLFLPYYYIQYAQSVNNYNGFPLDDPWIHLQFAKNLAKYGAFSYFKNEVVTAGSTSPIYTLILAVGFLVTSNEMWLSYFLGIIFFALSLIYFYKLSNTIFLKENWLALAAALIFILDKWINLISASGMETTLYIFLLISCLYYYRISNPVGFSITLGLTIWTRPDAVAFIAAILIDYAYRYYLKIKFPKENEQLPLFGKKDIFKIAVIAGLIIIAYFAMNLIISGSLFPNTYGAKLKYYSPDFKNRTEFLKLEVWQYFTESAYLLIFITFVIAIIIIIKDTFQLKYNDLAMPLLFIILLIFLYWYKLPYAHRFGRYLMPVIPFYILIAVYGGREFFKWLAKYFKDIKLANGLNIILLIITIIFFITDYNKNKKVYQYNCYHIHIRQVETANWLKQNTPQDAVIATHDVGAIAFYSERKIIDVVGLINPEFIPKLNSAEFVPFVKEQLNKQNVSYVAFLREWFQIVNQPVLFKAGDQNYEIMQVYQYFPDKTHILTQEVNSGLEVVSNLIANNQLPQAINVLNKLIILDPNSSLTYLMLAYVYSLQNNAVNAEKYLLKAIEIYPDYREAVFTLSNLYKVQNRINDAKNIIYKYHINNPSDSVALSTLNDLNKITSVKTDSLK